MAYDFPIIEFPGKTIVHNCPDSVLDIHISNILFDLRGEGEENVDPDLVGKIHHITRLYDEHIRSHFGIFSKLPTEDMVESFLRKTWSGKLQFFYIIDDLLVYSKEDGMDCAEMEFYYAIQISSIKIIPEIIEWAQEWSCGKEEDREFMDALPKWIENLPKEMSQYSRLFFD